MNSVALLLRMTWVLLLFSNNHKGMMTKCWEWFNMLRSWKRSCNWNMVQCLHQLCYFLANEWKMGTTIKATLPTCEMMQAFCLLIFGICCMSLMNLLCFLPMFSKYFIGVSQRLHARRLSFIGNLEVNALWQIHWMISLILIRLFRGLQL
jgi:hypothetical protein